MYLKNVPLADSSYNFYFLRFVNHEKSKKHREKAALLRQLLEEEEEELRTSQQQTTTTTTTRSKQQIMTSSGVNEEVKTGKESVNSSGDEEGDGRYGEEREEKRGEGGGREQRRVESDGEGGEGERKEVDGVTEGLEKQQLASSDSNSDMTTAASMRQDTDSCKHMIMMVLSLSLSLSHSFTLSYSLSLSHSPTLSFFLSLCYSLFLCAAGIWARMVSGNLLTIFQQWRTHPQERTHRERHNLTAQMMSESHTPITG